MNSSLAERHARRVVHAARRLLTQDYGLYCGKPAVLEMWSDGQKTVCRFWAPGHALGLIYEREIAYGIKYSWMPAADVAGEIGDWLRAQEAARRAGHVPISPP